MIRFFTRLFLLCIVATGVLPTSAFSQVTLGSSPYTETFDGIGTALPAGFSIYASATATSLGTAATLTTAPTLWNNTTGAFKNFASADIGSGGTQATATDRALGVRQTGAFGDAAGSGAAFVFQIANTTGKTGFNLAFKLQSLDASSPRVATFRIDYGFGSSPSVYNALPSANITGILTTGGSTFTNNAITADFSNILDNQAQVVTIRIVTLTATSGAGNRPSSAIDDYSLSWTAGPSVTPTITINNNGATTLQFPSTPINTTSAAQTYTVNAVNLIAPLMVSTTAPFMVSSDGTNFSTAISIAPNGSGIVAQPIYANFTPTASGAVSGTITNASTNATSKLVTPSGEAIDPNNLSFNFNTCTNLGVPGSGFYAYNVTGPQVWTCTSFGANGTNGVNMNGYLTTAVNNEDWLISPPLKISALTTPVLSFNSKGEFSGPILQLLASTNYDGVSNPNLSTWAPLNGGFLAPSGGTLSTFNFSDNINLSAYKAASKLYIAFKYVSDTIAGAARWTLDDININDRSTLFSVSPPQLFYGETSVGASSAGQAVILQSLGHKDVTVAAPAQFQVSLDNSIFANSIVIDSVTAKAGTTFFVKFAPTTKAIKQAGLLHFTGTGVDTSFVALSGSSYPKSETIDIACFNMSFFGAGSNNDATPAARNLQKTNLEIVYNRLNADIIGVEEVSSDSVFNRLVSELPGYAGFLSPKWSYFFQPFDNSQPGFPPQKIGFVYNTKTVKFIDSHVIDGAQYDSLRAGTLKVWSDYPTGDPTSFYSSGRLPILATFDVTIGGITKRIRMVDIHAKAIGDLPSYNRRVYDAKVLKDTLDKYYANDNVIIVGDYNDRLVTSIYLGSTVSPYNPFVVDKAGYKALTYSLDSAGKSSFVGSVGMIDQIICSNELIPNYIPNSTDIEPANTYISPYTATTASDHLPVYSRFVMNATPPVAFTGCPNVNVAVARPGYNTYNNEPVSIYNVDTTTGAATLIPNGPILDPSNNKNMDLNGVGLNAQDGFLYGIRDTGSLATNTSVLYRIGANYGTEPIGTIPAPTLTGNETFASVSPAAGGFDDNGNYYFIAAAGTTTATTFTPTSYYIGKLSGLSAISAGTAALTPTYIKMNFSGTNCSDVAANLMSPITSAGANAGTGFTDITFSNVFRRLYAYVSFQTTIGTGPYKGELLGLDMVSGTVTCYPTTSPLTIAAPNNEVAGISTTANGSLVVLFTGGDMYKTDLTSNGQFVGTIKKIGTSGIASFGAAGSMRGDLASCTIGKSIEGLPSGITIPGISVIAYPNPARGVATISSTTMLSNATVSLIGLAGNVISQKTGVSGNTFKLDLANTPSGVYLVEINQNGNISRVKIVIE